MRNLIAQTIGFIALFFTIISFQKNQSKKILYNQIASAFLFSVHYLILGAITAVVMNILSTTRNYIFYSKDKYKWADSKIWVYLYTILFILATVLTWKSNYTILPMIGMTASTIGLWMKNPTYVRLILLISPPCWFTYNFISGSIPGMIGEILTITSIIIAFLRFDIPKNKKMQI